MTASFFIFAAPRSRTAWLARFMTWGGTKCYHDLVAEIADLDAIKSMLDLPMTGVADTGMAHGWRLVRALYPAAKFAVIRRPRHEVEVSLGRCGIDPRWVDLSTLELRLDEISETPGTMTVQFRDLDDEECSGNLFSFCLDRPMPKSWWQQLRYKNIQIDMQSRLRLMSHNRDKMVAFRRQIEERTRDLLSA